MSILYLSIILLSISILELCNFNRKYCFIISTTLVYFYICFSYKLGVDWIAYYSLFHGLSDSSNYEVGFSLLSKTFNYLGVNFWIFTFLIKFIFLFTLFSMLKKYCYYPSSALTLIIIFLFPFINDPLRQLLAASFLFSGLLISKNHNISYKNILIGTLFHSSYIILLFTKLKKIEKKNLVIISMLIIIVSILILDNFNYLSLLGNNFIIRKILFYLSSYIQPNIYSLGIRIFFLYYICFNKNINLVNENILKNNIYSIFWILSFLLLLMEILAFQFSLLSQRLRLYLSPFPFILFLNYLFILKNFIKKLALFFIAFLYLYATLFNFVNGPMGKYYSLENNFFIQLFLNFPPNNIEENVKNFWLKN